MKHLIIYSENLKLDARTNKIHESVYVADRHAKFSCDLIRLRGRIKVEGINWLVTRKNTRRKHIGLNYYHSIAFLFQTKPLSQQKHSAAPV